MKFKSHNGWLYALGDICTGEYKNHPRLLLTSEIRINLTYKEKGGRILEFDCVQPVMNKK